MGKYSRFFGLWGGLRPFSLWGARYARFWSLGRFALVLPQRLTPWLLGVLLLFFGFLGAFLVFSALLRRFWSLGAPSSLLVFGAGSFWSLD